MNVYLTANFLLRRHVTFGYVSPMMGPEIVISLAKFVGSVGALSVDAARVTEFSMDGKVFVCLRKENIWAINPKIYFR